MSHQNDRYVKSGWHWTFGWLRRPELDDLIGFCYEDGDGDLYFTDNPHHKWGVYLDCWEDSASHEKYLCFSKIPRIMTEGNRHARRSRSKGR